jgi:hypothetical protein
MPDPAAPPILHAATARDGWPLALTADELSLYQHVLGALGDATGYQLPVMVDALERLGRLRAQRLENLGTTADLAAIVRAELDAAIGDLGTPRTTEELAALTRIVLDLTRAYTTLTTMAAAEAPPRPPTPTLARAERVEAAASAVLEAVAAIGHDRLEGAAEPLLAPVLELGEALDFWNPGA